MDEFSKLTSEARKPYFEKAAGDSALSIQVLEKDFWVCWTLKTLFSMPDIGEYLIFKGGTSLSKVFGVIERFSEDLDISIDRKRLGFADAKDPEHAHGSKQQQRLIEELGTKCREFVKNEILEHLRKDLVISLGTAHGWTMEIDEADPDRQTLLFSYPSGAEGKDRYIRPSVKIELGARSDHWPAHVHKIRPYLDRYLPDVLKNPAVDVKTLDAERTFWEKATILHMYAHWPEGKPVTRGQSRHYYDLSCLLRSKYKDEALKKTDLLKRVSEHKGIYFRAAWAKYDQAVLATLRLIPDARVRDEMKKDYAQMKEMFFAEPPTWDEVMTLIQEFETTLNKTKVE
jgi:hypothetical protein